MFGTFSFKGGVHPPHRKSSTAALAVSEFPAPAKVVIPLSQHIGAPAKPIVKKGDQVKIGQLLGEAGGFVSANIHASVSGKVTNVAPYPHPLGKDVMAVEIENDGQDEMVEFAPLSSWESAPAADIIKKISECGIVGMGGATFPSHVKLSPPADKPIDTLILNGAECEPYLTADHRLMLENGEGILEGTLIVQKILGAKNVWIAIEDNKPDAIQSIQDKLSDPRFKGFSVAKLQTKYPQGGEKQLIQAITKREVPSGGLPMHVGCVVHNVGTIFAIYEAITKGIPLYKRIVTVTGPTVGKPGNFLVRIGTPVQELLSSCEVDLGKTKKLITGGPMMGMAQSDITVPVMKSTSGILAYDTVFPGIREHACISCGNCVRACPAHLVPSTLGKVIDKEQYEAADEWNVLDCIECGSCAFVCPSKINLVHFMKLGKFHVMAARKAAAAKSA